MLFLLGPQATRGAKGRESPGGPTQLQRPAEESGHYIEDVPRLAGQLPPLVSCKAFQATVARGTIKAWLKDNRCPGKLVPELERNHATVVGKRSMHISHRLCYYRGSAPNVARQRIHRCSGYSGLGLRHGLGARRGQFHSHACG